MIVVACPGQGSQTPGFLSPWLELDGARERLEAYSDAAKVDLVTHGTVSDADTIRDTKIAQPLIVAASLLTWHALGDAAQHAGGVAGHSVGELAAIAATGVVSDETAMYLVGERGRAMAQSATEAATGMSAVVGGVEADVLAAIAEHDLQPANFNGGGQIVAAGALDGLAKLAEAAPRGARVIPLQVAGAFHTRYMGSAVEALRAAVATVTDAVAPATRLWTNSDGSVVADGQRALDLLVGQVSSPVRWDLCMQSFADSGITGLVELSPAGALVGLAKRGLKGTPTVAVKTPEDLEAAVALLNGVAA
ncbi:ACP S-malonyltransferase [Microbacterium sp. NC79]|uniref:ACP S-malonyltransferase n=1 Tax=Microbacterium sp. NC79 TaxID=2851009 RepID=UPI001C2C98AE|nr:ACP S-malonyltransferase [Microbacterium sp. NC79]